MAEQTKQPTAAIGVGRFSYLTIDEPKQVNGQGTAKYSLSFMIDKTNKKLVAKVKALIAEAVELGKEKYKWTEKKIAKFDPTLHDGDAERDEDEAYKGHYYLSCKSSQKPGLVNNAVEPIKSGDYGYVNITVYPYDKDGNVGVFVSLNHVMKTKDGEAFASRPSLDSAFDDVDFDELAEEQISGKVPDVDDLLG